MWCITEPHAIGITLPLVVMTGIEREGHIKTKDEESDDIRWEVPESKIHSKDDLEFGGNWSMKKAEIVCGCKERNFWNWSARTLGSVNGPDEAAAAVLDCSSL